MEQSNKHKICKYFEVPGNRQTFLGMPHIKTVDILAKNCNTTDTQETDRADKCSTNTAKCQGSRCEQHYTNMMVAEPKMLYKQQFKILQ